VNKEEFEVAYAEFTLWLIPHEPLRSTLGAIIARLAAQFDAVEFEPHVTVFCGPSTEAEARMSAVAIAAEFSPVELIAERLDYTNRYTKTLFLQFEESGVGQRMFEIARNGCSRRSDYVFNPHLSLLYKILPEAKQKALCRTLELPCGSYTFDRLRVIETELPIEEPGPVRRWRQVCDIALAGS
jgi:2'-5' RNA ligase